MVTDQMSGGTLISFIMYELELGECLEVRHVMILFQPRACFIFKQVLSQFVLPHRVLRPSIRV